MQWRTWTWACITMAIASAIAWLTVEPFWARNWAPPFILPHVRPEVSAPVDGPFYLILALHGYQWRSHTPTLLWFHPLVAVLIALPARVVAPQLALWIFTVLCALVCIVLAWRIAPEFFDGFSLPPPYMLAAIAAPAGISMATGNAEVPELLANLGLVASLLVWRSAWLSALLGLAAILIKPNALYMLPVLTVYLFYGLKSRDRVCVRCCLAGCAGIIAGLIGWIAFVDMHVGVLGAYIHAREAYVQDQEQTPLGFFDAFARSFLYSNDVRDRIRFALGLTVPLVNLWLLALIPFREERHRYALGAGYLAMMLIVLLTGNPNKTIVYATTLPSFLLINFGIVAWILGNISEGVRRSANAIGPLYAIYAFGITCVYVLGTPYAWYY
jgi:hypothetical protein